MTDLRYKVFLEVLPIVASFEGTGYSGVVGNFDGCGMTFGVIGFNIKQGSGITLLETLFEQAPLDAYQVVGEAGWEKGWTNKQWLAWTASCTTVGTSYVCPVVAQKVKGLLSSQRGIDAQHALAWEAYGARAWFFFDQFGFSTYRQFLFALDTTVQQGGFRKDALKVWQTTKSLAKLGQYMASLALPQWKHDVLARRMLIATGNGIVHNKKRNLELEYKTQLDNIIPIVGATDFDDEFQLPELPSRVD